MKRFVIKGVIFSIIILVVFLLLNQFFFHFVVAESFEFKEGVNYREFLDESKTIDFAFFGTSHMQHAINPEYLPNSFNFADSGKNYLLSYYQLKNLVENENVKINVLVLEIDPVSFSDHIYQEPFLFPYPNYYSGFFTLEDATTIQEREYLDVFLEYLFPFVGRGKEFGQKALLGFLGKYESEEVVLGWRKQCKDFDAESVGTLVDFQVKDEENLLVNERGVNSFIKIIELAKKNNILLVLLKEPYLKNYANRTSSQINQDSKFYADLFLKINKVTTEYSVIDYSDRFQDINYFFDPYHINCTGAKVVSKSLLTDINKIQSN